MLGNTLVGRYQIISHLGGGGFGETFVASDTHLPGLPKCVVKKLQPQGNDSATLEIARRLFDTEAQVLYKLGTHDRIPRLLAYFEENAEFYLVQEFISGDDLSKELTPGKTFTQDEVTVLLQEILTILEFVHQQNVIHRDINPRNLLRRQDGKLILIDFGAVKQITTQIVTSTGEHKSTVVIGTPGYIPGEQAQGNPKFSSDIYAVGIVAIQALTGLLPHQLEHDADTHEIIWTNYAQVSPDFAKFIDKMVCYDFRQRYPSATATLKALTDLTQPESNTIAIAPTLPPAKFRFNYTKKSIFIKLLLAILLISATGTVSVFVIKSINSNNATELAKQGNTFFELQRYQDALAVYQKAVELRPNYAQGWYGQGKTLFRLQRYQEALTAYDKAIQNRLNYVEAWSGRGFALQSLQRYAEAIASFDKALQLNNNYPEVWNARGEAFSSLKQYDQAIQSYDKAIEFQPDAYKIWYNKALALQSLKQYDEAIKAYNKVLEVKSDYETAWYNLGNALVNLNRYEDAFNAYDKAVQYKVDYSIAWLARGNVLIILRRYPEAVESFNQVIKFNPNNYQAWYGKGWSQHQNQRYPEAIESYNKAARIKPNNHQVWYSLGNSQYILQKYQEAIASYNKAVRYQANHYESWYSRGNAFLNLKQYQEAIASYEQAIKYKPDYHQAINARDEAQRLLQTTKPAPVVVPLTPSNEVKP